MKFIVEESLSQEIKDYLTNIHIKTEFGNELDLERIGRVVIDKETKNILLRFSCHTNYPISLVWGYILVYKKLRVIFEIESFSPKEHRVLSIKIPEKIWQERENILNLGIEMIYRHSMSAGLEGSKSRVFVTRKEYIVHTGGMRYIKEK